MSMKSLVFTSVALLFLLFAAPADAQDKRGWGLAVGIGVGQAKDTDGTEKFQGTAFGYSIEGEYRFSPNFALGSGIFSLGESSDTFNGVDTDLKVRGIGIHGRVILPLSDTVDVYGRVGGVSYYADLEPGGSNGLFGDDAVELGLGIDIGGGNNMAFRLEGRHFNGGRDETGNLFTLGFIYRW